MVQRLQIRNRNHTHPQSNRTGIRLRSCQFKGARATATTPQLSNRKQRTRDGTSSALNLECLRSCLALHELARKGSKSASAGIARPLPPVSLEGYLRDVAAISRVLVDFLNL